jgi:membrane-bound lytic murein transglycosylase B
VTDQAFAGVTSDSAVLNFDRRQRGTFRKSFEEYAATRVIPARINRARKLMQSHAALMSRIERHFCVPKELLMAIRTLGDNSTSDMGKLGDPHHCNAAHDCQRSAVPDR